MDHELHQKVTSHHRQRDAYLYVRQSTLRQVLENTESTVRQYGLRERAVALGWSPDRVVVIDCDLGQSGASTDREGFARLVAEVGMGTLVWSSGWRSPALPAPRLTGTVCSRSVR